MKFIDKSIAKALLVIACFSFVLAITGCATVFTEKSVAVTIHSNPEGANVFRNGEMLGQTPLTVEATPRSSVFSITKEGYEGEVLMLETGVNRTTHGNAAVFPLFPITDAVDSVTGNYQKIEQTTATVTLKKK
ncbi:PEGA domain-containing protein [Xenorhabdus bovienii]|uniref:PEGA domain-containing protein n=1 Tax=Xenorhabdus bovienii TaxID=40576 RepID=UPI0023B24C2E|nr:PEGA domain-containing protein [Xenorhabdus bovienii]MDE9487527.1 PEGA domain-containing protein [Xenorhabdus bovienii]